MRTTTVRSSLFTLGLCAATVLSPVPSKAQNDRRTAPPAAANVKPAAYDLEVAGGSLFHQGQKMPATLATVVDSLRDRYPNANIVLTPGLGELSVADIKLRASHLREELEAVRAACAMQFELQEPRTPEPVIDPTTGVPVPGPGDPDAGLFILRRAGPLPQTERVVEAFNIGPYLDWLAAKSEVKDENERRKVAQDQSMDQIARMIDETITTLMDPANPAGPPKLQFHPGASLLVVVGPRDSVEVARKIVNALPGMARTSTDFARPGWGAGGAGVGYGGGTVGYGAANWPAQPFPGARELPTPLDATKKRHGAPGQAPPPGDPPSESDPSR